LNRDLHFSRRWFSRNWV